jgi:HSP20 family protein
MFHRKEHDMADSKRMAQMQGGGQGTPETGSQGRSSAPQGGAIERRHPGSIRGLSPLDAMRRMTEEMDRTFDRILEGWGFSGRSGSRWDAGAGQAMWMPRLEAFEKGDTFIVRAELPGLKKDDIEVNVTDDEIVIQGQRQDDREEQREGFYHSERAYGRFYRAVPLPDGAIAERAEAAFKDGVLEVRVPSPPAEVRQGRRVEIQESSSASPDRGKDRA